MNTEYKYSYNIKPETDEEAFFETCKTIEKGLFGLKKEKLLVDVDGTFIQIYYMGKEEKIVVYDDYDVDAVYVNSNVDLEEVLGLKSIW